MARVPSADELGGNVLSPPAPVFRSTAGVTPEAFGAAQGRAIAAAGQQGQRFGAELVDKAIKRQLQDNALENKQALIQYNQELLELQETMLQKRGVDATEVTREFEAAVQNLRSTIAKGLSNKAVARDFGIGTGAPTLSARRVVGTHERTQRFAAANDLDDRLIAAHANTLASDPMNPENMTRNLDTIEVLTRVKMDRNGIEDEVAIAEQVRIAQSDALELAVKRIAVNNPTLAREFYDSIKGNPLDPNEPNLLTPEDRIDIEETLIAGDRAELAAANQRLIMAQKLLTIEQEKTADEMLQAIEAADTPADLEAIRGRIAVSNMTSTQKRTAINYLKAAKKGDDVLATKFYEGIHAPPGSATRVELQDIYDNVGRLGLANARQLEQDIKRRDEPIGKAQASFFAGHKAAITKSNFISKDVIGEVNFSQFKFAVRQLEALAVEKGLDPMLVYTPGNDLYAGRIVTQYQRTTEEGAQTLENLGTGFDPRTFSEQVEEDIEAPSPAVIVEEPAPAPADAPQIREGESDADFLKRLGL
ncbi:MAG: hypothetical protein V3V96_15310 [Acidiferrobacterales bacterium]